MQKYTQKSVDKTRTLDNSGLYNKKSTLEAIQLKIFRSREVIQGVFKWSADGDDGVIIGDNIVIKLGGYDAFAESLDQLAASFGFKNTNARIIMRGDADWEIVENAVVEVNGWERNNSHAAPKNEALIMDKLEGVPLYEASNKFDAGDPDNPTAEETDKIKKICNDLGKMLVMDLLTRNNDRFYLTEFDDLLLATPEEQTEDDDAWRPWKSNTGNMLVDEATGETNPIDSQFTVASNEDVYAGNIAILLTDRIDDLTTAGISILEYDHNWFDKEYAKTYFKEGIEWGIQLLLGFEIPETVETEIFLDRDHEMPPSQFKIGKNSSLHNQSKVGFADNSSYSKQAKAIQEIVNRGTPPINILTHVGIMQRYPVGIDDEDAKAIATNHRSGAMFEDEEDEKKKATILAEIKKDVFMLTDLFPTKEPMVCNCIGWALGKDEFVDPGNEYLWKNNSDYGNHTLIDPHSSDAKIIVWGTSENVFLHASVLLTHDEIQQRSCRFKGFQAIKETAFVGLGIPDPCWTSVLGFGFGGIIHPRNWLEGGNFGKALYGAT